MRGISNIKTAMAVYCWHGKKKMECAECRLKGTQDEA